MMFSCLLTLETAGAAVGDKAACCCSLCSISCKEGRGEERPQVRGGRLRPHPAR